MERRATKAVRWALVGGAIGLLVPLLLLSPLGSELAKALGVPRAAVNDAVWPSAFVLLATAGGENTLGAYGIVAIAVAANVVLYSCLACALFVLWRGIRWIAHVVLGHR
jgi:hypothetical protein